MTPQIPHIPRYFTVNLPAVPPLPEKCCPHRSKYVTCVRAAGNVWRLGDQSVSRRLNRFRPLPPLENRASLARQRRGGCANARKWTLYGTENLTVGREPCQTPMPTATAAPVTVITRGTIGRVAAATVPWLAAPEISVRLSAVCIS